MASHLGMLEAANLQNDLRRAGTGPWAWFINNSIAAAHTRSPLLMQRAATERKEIAAVANEHAQRYAVVPLLSVEPVGQQALRGLSDSSAAAQQSEPA